ncbi:MAG: glycosyltransferase family 39 protein [Anaerolineales bacterium]|nr:glycosyltransferase family 39 protein [Anaerolineales bacterium]
MNEPSVLDYLIERLTFWREKTVQIPSPETPADDQLAEGRDGQQLTAGFQVQRWLIWLPPLLAWAAQLLLEPPSRSVLPAVILYLGAAGVLLVLVWKNFWAYALPSVDQAGPLAEGIKWKWLVGGLLSSLLAFFLFLGNRFSLLNTPFWLFGLAAVIVSLWSPRQWFARLRLTWERFLEMGFRISPWQILTLAVFGLAAFFRFYRLGDVPPEMFSDHAEKLIDVSNVLRGQYAIFFIRNTGREAFQMYLTAAVARLFNTGISFLSLKIGTSLAGLLMLPYIYLLGKELANRRVGLMALFTAGVAYWPNVTARVALRFALYPLFAAPTLFYLIRGLRERRRNDFIYAGLALGLGLHGYSPFRVVPVLVVIIVLLFFLHQRNQKGIRTAVQGLLIAGLISTLIFLPLIRFALNNPEIFTYRMNTRMTSLETELPGPPLVIFLKNLAKSAVMFQWDNGNIWVHSIPGRPALGVISAGLFSLGVLILLVRYLKKRHWLDVSLLVSIPVLMLPSVLSLAFPAENPSLNRSGGAIIPVFILVGLGLDSIWLTLKKNYPGRIGKWLAGLVVVIVLGLSAVTNGRLVFRDYYQQFKQSAWNTSEMGEVIRQFADTVGSHDQVWVVPYPHWVDTRLVGIHAEREVVDYALGPEEIPLTQQISSPKMFLVKPEDEETLRILQEVYPEGLEKTYISEIPSRNFLIYYVLR